jgi:hypothetical protein
MRQQSNVSKHRKLRFTGVARSPARTFIGSMALVLAMLTVFAPISLAQAGQTQLKSPPKDWNRYVNVRFGYGVSFPLRWVAGEESLNSDGKVIRSKTGDTLTVYGGEIEFEPTTDDYLSNDYPSISYRRVLADGWVVSGYTANGEIFYTRLRRSAASEVYAVMELRYPKRRKTAMDPVVKIISRSFSVPSTATIR